MNGNLCPRSQSVSSGGVVQLGSTASATSVPSASVYSIHRHPANIGHIQHSQSQQWQSVGGGGGVNGATASLGGGDAGGATFIVRRQSSRQQDGGVQRRVRLPPSGAWMERVFQRRDCIKFIPADDHSDRCQCGRVSASHSQLALSRFTTSVVVRRGTDGGDTPADGPYDEEARWTIGGCTAPSPTDAYGVIQFQGGPHVHKARYVRLSFDSEPADVLRLMVREWDLSMPRLVISVQGGMTDFEVPAKLGKVFREGLLKAAETTGAWVITAGVDSGVVKHVAKALDEAGISPRMRSRIVTVGIAPWGLLQRRERLVGRNAQVPYDRHSASPSSARRCSSGASSSPSGGLVLNDRHSYFLLADNGTVGRYGADIVLRKRLEEFLASRTEKKVYGGRRTATATESSSCSRIPIVCVVLEGGLCTLNPVHRYLTGTPSIPVIICEGSGRISDIVSFAARHLTVQRTVPMDVHAQLLCQVRQLTCHSGLHDQMNSSDAIVDRIVQCARNRDGLLTIFRLNNGMQNSDVPSQMDHAILRALLQAQNLSPVDQLLMTLAWGREDIARREIFRQGHKRPGDGHQQMDSALLVRPMMEALLMRQVEFVKLFLEQGLSLKRFLTIDCLEKLYNAECAMDALMKNGRRGAERRRSSGRRRKRRQTVTLPEIGVAIERLMGNAYRSTYTTREFKMRYERAKFGGIHPTRKSATRNFSSLNICLGALGDRTEGDEQNEAISPRKCAVASPVGDGSTKAMDAGGYGRKRPLDFEYPFNELMLWAVLTRRHEMANLFWQYSEEPMAKALVAIRLYKCMSREAAHDYTEVEVSNQLRECANTFRDCSLELLHNCHQQDSQLTMRLLTAELPNWGHHTCLSLAVIANNKRFLAHPCCQILLAELWHGGLRFRSQSNVKVVLGILFPPSILLLDFKTTSFGNRPPLADTSNKELDEQVEGDGDSASSDQQQEDEDEADEGGAEEELTKGRRCWEEAEERCGGEQRRHFVRCHCFGGYRGTQTQSELIAPFRRPPSPIASVLSKFVLFYGAPITSFWIWFISYVTFMLALIFVLLVEFPTDKVPPIEWFLFIYVLSLAMEHFRKLFVLESSSLLEKLSVFYNRYWNILTTVSVLSYFLGFIFRFNPATVHTYSRTILASNSVLWHMKLFDFLGVHPRIGPYITMAGKMVLAMSYIVVLLMVTLMAFGVARQSITFPHEKWAWILVRNIFYKPYFMLYGEVYAGEIDTCGDEGTNCVPGGWIPPVLMTIFLLVANILLINMLIAIFNNIFNVTNAMSQQVWMFQRYEQVLEYKSTPILPPPLTPLAHLLMLFRNLFKPKQRPLCPLHSSDHRGGTMAQEGSFSLKVQLPSEELRELQDFEEDCMDDLSRRKVRNTSDGFNEWEQWEDGGKAEDVASFRPNQLISCCCCGRTQQRWEKGEEPIPPMRIPLAGGGEERTNDGREAEEIVSHSSPSAELRTVNADVNVQFNDGNLQLTQSTHQDGPKPVADTNGRRQLRVAPMPTVKRPHNSSSLLNHDIDQMLLAVLRGEGGGADRVIAQRS